MAITTIDGILNGLGNNAQTIVINKATITGQLASVACSMWRATGIPAQGAIPTTAVNPTSATVGAAKWDNPTGGMSSYIARAFMSSTIASTDAQFHDRLGHMGGLSGLLTISQTVNLSVAGSNDNLPLRRGGADYSDVQWWMEWYTATGATVTTPTVTYTRADGTSGRTQAQTAWPASVPASRMYPIFGQPGEYIQSIQSIQLSASTLTAGNWGITATRGLGGLSLGLVNYGTTSDWQQLGFPRVQNDAALQIVVLPATTSSGTLYGSAKLIQG